MNDDSIRLAMIMQYLRGRIRYRTVWISQKKQLLKKTLHAEPG